MQHLNITPFCEFILHHKETNSLEFVWAEPRDIFSISIHFKTAIKMEKEGIIKHLKYWQANWPQNMPKEGEKQGSGASGWHRQDDWYKGIWVDADYKVEKADSSNIYIEFNELTNKEILNSKIALEFRRTLKLMIIFDSKSLLVDDVESVDIFTDSVLEKVSFNIESKLFNDQSLKIKLDEVSLNLKVFNGILGELRSEESKLNKTKVDGYQSVFYAKNLRNDTFDKTYVTIEPQRIGFDTYNPHFTPITFAIDDLLNEGYIFAPDLGYIIIKDGRDDLSFDVLTQLYQTEGKIGNNPQSVYDRIFNLPEQTFQNAMREFAEKKILYIVIGMEGSRTKCAVTPRGDLSVTAQYLRKVPGSDTKRVFWHQEFSRIKFDWFLDDRHVEYEDLNKPTVRAIESDFLPIIKTTWVDSISNVNISQTAFATALAGLAKLPQNGQVLPKDMLVAMLKFELKNQDIKGHTVRLYIPIGDISTLHMNEPSPVWIHDRVTIKEGSIIEYLDSTGVHIPYLFQFQSLNEKASARFPIIKDEEGCVCLEFLIGANEETEFLLKMPLLAIKTEQEIKNLMDLDWTEEHKNVVDYWTRRVEPYSHIKTPEEELNNFYKAHLIHMLITNTHDIGSERIIGQVGSMGYGCYANEVCMVLNDLDRRGLHNQARRILDTFIHYQGTVGLDGNYEDIEGIFFGAGGYESGVGYNQNQGFVLSSVADHVLIANDYDWLQANLEPILKGCNWIINERKVQMKQIEDQTKIEWQITKDKGSHFQHLYYGLLPPGGVEDITDYWWWLSTNAYNAFGLLKMSKLLAKIKHPESERLLKEAHEYWDTVKNNFGIAMEQSPVIRLKNGTFQPHIPCYIPRRSRGFGWIQETLEGAIHLIRCGILDPKSREATQIIKDYEDNLYLSDEYGYPYVGKEFEKYWFNRGGFSMQPFLLSNHILYAIRSEPKHFLRAVFNAFAVNYRPDTKMFTEHPLPTMFDWFGRLYKTSDEAQFFDCFRHFFVQEEYRPISSNYDKTHIHSIDEPNSLKLFSFMPESWYTSYNAVNIANLPSLFGMVSESYEFGSSTKISIFIKIERQSDSFQIPLEFIILDLRIPDTIKVIKHSIIDLQNEEGKLLSNVQNHQIEVTIPKSGQLQKLIQFKLLVELK